MTHIRGNVAGGPLPEFDLANNDGAGVQSGDQTSMEFILRVSCQRNPQAGSMNTLPQQFTRPVGLLFR